MLYVYLLVLCFSDNIVVCRAGVSGSGKTYASMVLLRRLFDVAGGGPETDAFKHLAAAFTVLRALGTAATPANTHSSRIVSIARRSPTTLRRMTTLNYNLCVAGSLHRGAGDGRSAVPHQDSLLLPRPNARGTSARRRAKLSHLLPDARRTHTRRARTAPLRRLRATRP